MTTAEIFKQYLEHLFAGNRTGAREVVMSAQDRGTPACKLLKNIIWPAMEQIEKLYASHHITTIIEHMATRINRQIADQLQSVLLHHPKNGQRMIVMCGDQEGYELGGQITADLFEGLGWTVYFVGAGIPSDEVLQMIGKIKPDFLTIYGAKPQNVPELKNMVELIREVSSCENLQILTIGGVFSRAQGLAEELKIDHNADNISDAIQVVTENPIRQEIDDTPEPGRRRRRKRTAGRPSAPKTVAKISTAA